MTRRGNAEWIEDYCEEDIAGADVVVVSYGITSRTALPAIDRARAEGVNVGHLRLRVVWPFPEKKIREIAESVKAIVVPELNMGQIALEVERCAAGKAAVHLVGHVGGTVHNPNDIYEKIMKSIGK